ncbi:MAG: glycine--tRNA ligase subunit beta [Deltaproteobacteria bacterium]
MGKELILEIGTEEIPAGFMNDAITNLAEIAKQELNENALSFGQIETFGTPRRLTLRIKDLSEKQEDQFKEFYGPPVRIAFDEDGNPTRATVGFAKSQGVEVGELVRVERDRGEFLAAVKHIKGQKTEKLLIDMLPEIITSLPFRKSMKWGEGETTFARPIRWILALYGGKKVPFSVEEVKSGGKSYGHRFMHPKGFKVSGWEDYAAGLENGYVVLDQEKRRESIAGGIKELARRIGGTVYEDEELLETVTYLVEYPVVLKGDFEEDFLKLPKEVLVSVMKNHQKYFPVFSNSGDGELLPHFIFVCGTRVKDTAVVVKGNERVIRARFTDARFFYEEDKSVPLSDRTEDLKGMVFLSDLGTYYDKTERIKILAKAIGQDLGLKDELTDIVRAAEISKSDLATQMVFEFPELQGTMGKYYAGLSGEKEEVARAIEEQYMPTSREGELPATDYGSIISIADKVDTVSACFISGLIPTGTSDPYALRRQAIAIINIVIAKTFHLDLDNLFRLSLDSITEQTGGKFDDPEGKTLNEIMEFIKERVRHIMIGEGFSHDVVDAVISAGFDDIVEVKRRIEALGDFRTAPEFEPLGVAFKRVVNIVKGQPKNEVDKELLMEPVEKELFESFVETQKKVGREISDRNYSESLSILKDLKEPVDKFFDNVLVMDENPEIRQNRLSMLWAIRDLFFKIADFSKLSTQNDKT